MIKSRTPSLTVDQIRCIRVQPGETLHCAVNIDGLPTDKTKDFLEHVRSYLLSNLPAGMNLLVTTDKVTFTVIQSQP